MIRRLLARLIPGRPAREPRIYARGEHPVRRDQVPRGARMVMREAARSRLQGVRRRRRRARSAARPRRRRTSTSRPTRRPSRSSRCSGARTSSAAASASCTCTSAPRCSRCRRSARAQNAARTRPTSTAACCPTTSTARRPRTPPAATSRSTRSTSTRSSEEIWDYVGGVVDIRARRLKLIGAPVTRFREDPVRMLRAVRLAAKVGLAIDPKTAAPIPKLATPRRRTCRRRACSTRCRSSCFPATPSRRLQSLRAHGLSHGLLPLLDVILEQPLGTALHRGGARRAPTRACARARRFRRRSCSQRSCGTKSCSSGTRAKARGERADAGAVRRDGPRAGSAGGAHLDPAPVRGDDQGDLGAAAALRAARGRSGRIACSSTSASAPRTISCRCAPSRAKCRRRWSTGGRASRTRRKPSARRCCGRTRRRSKPRRSRGRGRKRREDGEAPRVTAPPAQPTHGRERRCVACVGLGSNLAHPRRQLARAVAALARMPRTRVVARLAQLRDGAASASTTRNRTT